MTLQRVSGGGHPERELDRFDLPSQPGNERQAMERVALVVAGLPLEPTKMERLKTAVAEATMNAMEHGNKYQADVPVTITVSATDGAVIVRIADEGGGQPIPVAETPDLLAKLAGEQSPRGWGLFLIQNMVDEFRTADVDQHHIIELVLHFKQGDEHNVG